MKLSKSLLLLPLLTAVVSCAFTAKKLPTNPIIWADVPDVSVMRVGEDYYMSSTTMHMSPGLPIMKSKDLVNWQLLGYAYDTLADNDALTLSNNENAYGRGSWASSLRFHEGHYYVSTFSASTGKTHIFKTIVSGIKQLLDIELVYLSDKDKKIKIVDVDINSVVVVRDGKKSSISFDRFRSLAKGLQGGRLYI